MSRIKKKSSRRNQGWVYLRYCLPILVILLILVAIRIPCLQYTTADTGANDAISAWELAVNAFDQSRGVLFGSEEQTEANLAFSRTILISLILCVILFFIGCAVAIWSVIDAFRYVNAPMERSNAHIAFITLIPNRPVFLLWLLCLLPLPAFPRLTVLIYQVMLNYTVTLKITFADPLLIAAILLVAEGALLALLAATERELGMDPFHRRKKKGPETDEEEMTDLPHPARQESILMSKTREEQLEQIRRMLNGDREDPPS